MHIVVINRWPRFQEGPRWDFSMGRFEELIDHERHQVSYVVDAVGATGVLADPERIADLVEVEDLNDFEALCGAVQKITDRVGPVDRLIAVSEATIGIAAEVRAALGIAGPRPEDVALYRNKLRMKEAVAKAGIRTPRFASCGSAESAVDFARATGFPLILKPVSGAGSRGVHRVEDEATLTTLLDQIDTGDYELEEYIDGPIYHVDGFVGEDSQIPFMAVSRYINDCLSFEAAGQPLGSVVVQASPLRSRVEEFARRCVSALNMASMPFHLELFVTAEGDLVFLEIAGRIGGAEVPYLTDKLFGVNLFELWLDALCEGGATVPPQTGDPSGGWLIIPKPAGLPAEVVSVTSMRDHFTTVWRELVPTPGEVMEPGGSYDAVHSGRFILTGDESAVEEDIREIIARFRIETAPVPQ
ncbi:ATP-grasp domain-containing protein [Streptomyces monashensis]|uniref:Biotin carboxylase n=1 Tax=Streptomyces monashensis TaxID=1678012 RepID=A0A1S2QEF2_9ACTN|nr:ATP-grasp domain-containing protein [Streptomyces monashensis]OIK04500.1 biotin carboxylase [Streptomyces monashensis]